MRALPWQYAPALVGRTCMAAQGDLRCMFSGAGAVPTAADSMYGRVTELFVTMVIFRSIRRRLRGGEMLFRI